MKANELRINNWYMSVKFDVPVQCDLSDLMELYYKSDGAIDDPPIDEMFEPIHISEEWLIKFGFEKYVVTDTSRILYSKEPIKESDLVVCFRHRDIHVDIMRDYSGYALRELLYDAHMRNRYEFVHEIQNLIFALTGNELELTK